MRRWVASGLAAALVLAAPAFGQSFGGASSSDLLGYRSSAAQYSSRAIAAQIRSRPDIPPRQSRPSRPVPARPLGSTTFRPVGGSIFPAQLAAAVPHNTAARGYFEDLLSAYKELLQDRGVAPNDVSRAAAFLISNSYTVIHNGQQLSAAQFDGLRAQIAELYAADPEFQRLPDRERQALYERYAVFGMHLLTAQSYFTRTRDERELAQTRALARQQIEDVLGVPADRLVFKPDGIYAR